MSSGNWHNEVLEQEGWFDMSDKEFAGFVYCEECYAIVSDSDECLCLIDRPDFVQDVLDRARGMQQAANSAGLGVVSQCCGGGCN